MISIQNVGFGYRKGERLFDGLDLRVRTGGIYGLLGRNGAGKSTLLKLMTGCLKPKEGSVKLFDAEAFDRHPEVLQRLFFLPEQVYLPASTWSRLERAYGSFYPKYDAALFAKGLEAFGVPTDRKLSKLSLGQQKKGLIAFSLACQTDLLILDEPSNGLDIPSKAILRRLLAEAVSDERAIVVSTHQVRDLAGLIDPVLIIEGGRMIAHLDLATVSERFSFELVSSMTPPADAIYSERVAGGHYVVRDNTIGNHTEPDLEVLFNALTAPDSEMLAKLNAHLQTQNA